MAIGGNVNFTISARDAASKVVKNVQNNIKTMAKGFAIAAAAIAAAVTAAAGAIAAFGVSAVKAAMEDAAAQKILVSTLEARGLATEKNLASTEKAIEAAQKLAFTDDDVRSSISIATQFTNKFSQALKIQKVAMDVSRGKNISLAQATKIVGNAFNGSTGAAKKLGIELPKNAKGMKAVNAVGKSFTGVAKGYSETLQGQFESFGIALAETKESIGGALLPALERTFKGIQPVIDDVFKTIEDAIPDLKKFADSFTKNIPNLTKNAWANIKKNLPEIIDKIKDFGTGVLDLLRKAKDFIGTDGSITIGLATIGAKLGGFGGALTAVFAKGFTDLGFGPIEAGIAGAVTAGLTGSIAKAAMDTFVQVITQKIVAANIARKLLPSGGVPIPGGTPVGVPPVGTAPIAQTVLGVGVAAIATVAAGAMAAAGVVAAAKVLYDQIFTPEEQEKNMMDNYAKLQARVKREGLAAVTSSAGGVYGSNVSGGSSDYLNRAITSGVVEGFKMAPMQPPIDLTNRLELKLDGKVVAQSVSRYLGLSDPNPRRTYP
jgi:hypothetical protein